MQGCDNNSAWGIRCPANHVLLIILVVVLCQKLYSVSARGQGRPSTGVDQRERYPSFAACMFPARYSTIVTITWARGPRAALRQWVHVGCSANGSILGPFASQAPSSSVCFMQYLRFNRGSPQLLSLHLQPQTAQTAELAHSIRNTRHAEYKPYLDNCEGVSLTYRMTCKNYYNNGEPQRYISQRKISTTQNDAPRN